MKVKDLKKKYFPLMELQKNTIGHTFFKIIENNKVHGYAVFQQSAQKVKNSGGRWRYSLYSEAETNVLFSVISKRAFIFLKLFYGAPNPAKLHLCASFGKEFYDSYKVSKNSWMSKELRKHLVVERLDT